LKDGEDFPHCAYCFCDVTVARSGEPNNLVVLINDVKYAFDIRMRNNGTKKIFRLGSKWIPSMVKKTEMGFPRSQLVVNEQIVWNIKTRESES
jgi:hypothetical protein